jgi:nucleotide-binding universal stress UspA family protein
MNNATSDTIVVGLDGSQCSDRALEWAIVEAQRSGRQLVLVHAWHWSDDLMSEAKGPAGGSNVRKAGHVLLDRAAVQTRRQAVAVRPTWWKVPPPPAWWLRSP